MGIRHHCPIRDEQGIITHFVAIKEDITQRKKTAALHASELKYRSVFATVGDALFLMDNKNGRIPAGQPGGLQAGNGYTREEFLGMRDTDLSVATEGDARGSCRA